VKLADVSSSTWTVVFEPSSDSATIETGTTSPVLVRSRIPYPPTARSREMPARRNVARSAVNVSAAVRSLATGNASLRALSTSTSSMVSKVRAFTSPRGELANANRAGSVPFSPSPTVSSA
jgi:hypothetical protein